MDVDDADETSAGDKQWTVCALVVKLLTEVCHHVGDF
jgi:hypothetical protein